MHCDFPGSLSAVRSAVVYSESARKQSCGPDTDSGYSESKTFTLYTRNLSSNQLALHLGWITDCISFLPCRARPLGRFSAILCNMCDTLNRLRGHRKCPAGRGDDIMSCIGKILTMMFYLCLNFFLQFDLTLYIALIFIVHFLLLLIAIFFLMMHLMTVLIGDTSDYSFILVQIPITVSMLLVSMPTGEVLSFSERVRSSVRYVPHSNHIWRQIPRDESRRGFFGIPVIVPWLPHYLLAVLQLADQLPD